MILCPGSAPIGSTNPVLVVPMGCWQEHISPWIKPSSLSFYTSILCKHSYPPDGSCRQASGSRRVQWGWCPSCSKVTEPVQSKLTNRMTSMMTMRTFPWTRSQPLSLGHQDLLVQQLWWASSRWWTTQGGLTMCTKKGKLIPLFGKRNLMQTSVFGSSLMRIGMRPWFLARTTWQ
jgi:hypothetical protein